MNGLYRLHFSYNIGRNHQYQHTYQKVPAHIASTSGAEIFSSFVKVIGIFLQLYKTGFTCRYKIPKVISLATIPESVIMRLYRKNIRCTAQSPAPIAFNIPIILIRSNTRIIRQVIRLITATAP